MTFIDERERVKYSQIQLELSNEEKNLIIAKMFSKIRIITSIEFKYLEILGIKSMN